MATEPTGEYARIVARRVAGLALVKCPRARAAILGVPYRFPAPLENGSAEVSAPLPPKRLVVLQPRPEILSWAQRIAEVQARRLMKKIGTQADPSITIAQILDAVAEAYELSLYALSTKDRTNRASYPRFAAMKLMRELRLMSTSRIGVSLGKLDHTSVLHGLKRAAEFYERGLDWRTRYDRALALLGKNDVSAASVPAGAAAVASTRCDPPHGQIYLPADDLEAWRRLGKPKNNSSLAALRK